MRAALGILALLAAPAAAHDLPPVEQPPERVTVTRPLLPQWGTQGGEGRVRLVYHSPKLAARMAVTEFAAYERAYARRLTALMMRMPLASADPIARHGAWHDVVGEQTVPVLTMDPLPERREDAITR
ncbi:hypothetical protein [Jannaschia sp. W003]|uniref:hypothetical protein n=1 Tax=Jannaschia sp. W003 TaxID=2867012 RepID=UPI0021A7577A|nr:hypothetical protein [Jannaschia sp. W003]UWQ21167.1 hypothetical protein K3554_14510 [Jannaschia sp. W003]